MFCTNCGNNLPDNAVFCTHCGAQLQNNPQPRICKACGTNLPEDAVFCTNCGVTMHQPGADPENKPVQTFTTPQDSASQQKNPTLIGWSSRSHHPEIMEAAKKSKKSAMGCAWFLILLFPVGFALAGLLIDEMPLGEALVIGVGLGVLMLIINLIRIKMMKRPVWEGTVIKKYDKDRRKYNKHDDSYTNYTEFTVVVKTDAGKEKRMIEKGSERHMYDYLKVGDRVRYYPTFDTFEKYDKSKDRIIYCNVCRMMNPITNDRCKRCNQLLFK